MCSNYRDLYQQLKDLKQKSKYQKAASQRYLMLATGIMLAKTKVLADLENTHQHLQRQLQQLLTVNESLTLKESTLDKHIQIATNKLNLLEITGMENTKTIRQLNQTHSAASKRLVQLKSTSQFELRHLKQLQTQLQTKNQELENLQLLQKRLAKEIQATKKVVSAPSQQVYKQQKGVTKAERDLQIIKNSVASKEKFIGVLEKKNEANNIEQNNNKVDSKAKTTRKVDFEGVIQSVDSIKKEQMKEFQKLVRTKNLALLKHSQKKL